MEGRTNQQLVNLFNSLFNKDSLRRNIYIFNSLNESMELPIKTVARERRVSQITSDLNQVIEALKQCLYVQVVSTTQIKILLKGDQLIVRLMTNNSVISKKDLQALTKQMKCQIKQDKAGFLIQFQSQSAVREFQQRIKTQHSNIQLKLIQKSPYSCLQQSINNIKKDKKNPKQTPVYQQPIQTSYANYLPFQTLQYYSAQYPPFIRKAVDSDQQTPLQSTKNTKKYMQKTKKQPQPRVRFDSADFPSFDNLTINSKKQQEEAQ